MCVCDNDDENHMVRREYKRSKKQLESQLKELEQNIKEQEDLIKEKERNEEELKELSAQYEQRMMELQEQVGKKVIGTLKTACPNSVPNFA